jgi:excisionase family DNA binding protein
LENRNQSGHDAEHEFLSVREAARHLGINEKKVYALVNAGRIPGTKVTGKWLFPRRELDRILHQDSSRTLKRFSTEYALSRSILLVAGSDDPVLSMIQGLLHQENPELVLFSASIGSSEGLRLLRKRFCHIALSHLYDPDSSDYNFPFIRRIIPEPEQIAVINLFHRQVGFVSREPVESFSQLVERGRCFVNRQPGSGIRSRVDQMLTAEGIGPKDLKGYDQEVFTHLNVALHVAAGHADAGIASEAVARSTGLEFTPLSEERFDAVLFKETFFEQSVQVFVELLRSDCYTRLIDHMSGYDSRESGKILYPVQSKGDSE